MNFKRGCVGSQKFDAALKPVANLSLVETGEMAAALSRLRVAWPNGVQGMVRKDDEEACSDDTGDPYSPALTSARSPLPGTGRLAHPPQPLEALQDVDQRALGATN
eukprot:6215290-Amphidinium_carterae.1